MSAPPLPLRYHPSAGGINRARPGVKTGLRCFDEVFSCHEDWILFLQQVAVCPCANQCLDQHILVYAIKHQPIRLNMTFSVSKPVASQRMIPIMGRKRFPFGEEGNDLFEQFDISSLPDSAFIILPKLRRWFYRILCLPHWRKLANKTSRSSYPFTEGSFSIRSASLIAAIVSALGSPVEQSDPYSITKGNVYVFFRLTAATGIVSSSSLKSHTAHYIKPPLRPARLPAGKPTGQKAKKRSTAG